MASPTPIITTNAKLAGTTLTVTFSGAFSDGTLVGGFDFNNFDFSSYASQLSFASSADPYGSVNHTGLVFTANGIDISGSGLTGTFLTLTFSVTGTLPASLSIPIDPTSDLVDEATNSYTFSGPLASSVMCFAEGTLIETDRGPVPVEAIRPGDRVVVQCAPWLRPVVWVGRREVEVGRHPDPDAVRPVCVRAGALAPNVPLRDVLLSPDHALFLDGALVPVRLLANGRTIHPVPAERVAYVHVELDAHDVLVAEGMAAESFLDTGQRHTFANEARHPAQVHPQFAMRVREAQSCAPLLLGGPALDALRARLAPGAPETLAA